MVGGVSASWRLYSASRILEGLNPRRGLVEPRKGIGCGAAAVDKKPARAPGPIKEGMMSRGLPRTQNRGSSGTIVSMRGPVHRIL